MSMVFPFSSLYLATLLLLVSSGLFNTYVGVRLSAAAVSEVWIGAIMAAYYFGLVLGARTGHKLIIRVGHIRAYSASAALTTVLVLAQTLVDSLWLWLVFRVIAGIAMVTMFMALESWLNEQTENHLRGRVFAFYMVFSGLGTVLGQMALPLFPQLNDAPLVVVAMCTALCLVPIAVTRRLHPALQVPAPLNVRYYVARVRTSIIVLLIAGMITGAFYGLAPAFIARQGVTNQEVSLFLAAGVAAGLLSQWPMGWLADRVHRAEMIRINAILLMLLTIPLWGWWQTPYWALLAFSCVIGILQFTLYPLGLALANDNITSERRVGLSAIMLMVYGLGASIGPLVAGFFMRQFDPHAFYIFTSFCAGVLAMFVHAQRPATAEPLRQEATTAFVPMPDTLQSSPVAATLDPRVDPARDVSHEPAPPEDLAELGPEEAEDGLTTSQSASLAVHGEVKRGSPHTEPKAPLTCGGEAPTARSEFFTEAEPEPEPAQPAASTRQQEENGGERQANA